MTTEENEDQIFNRGERVLCYEPDDSKARVLYVSKVLAVYERKDEKNHRYFDYKIHFQGWSSTWDRNVRASSLLKDNEVNRKLQRELAEAAQVQKSGGYTYKDTKTPTVPSNKKKRMTKIDTPNEKEFNEGVRVGSLINKQEQHLREQIGNRSRDNSGNRSRDNSGERKAQLDKSISGDATMKESRKTGRAARERKSGKSQFSLDVSTKDANTLDADKKIHQEDRVMLRISERLREYMEYDYNMICSLGKQHAMPASTPIVTIMENFVKQRAVELAIGIKQDSSRARNTKSRNARMEREYDRVMSIVCMLKEVVDGLRIYFEFHLEEQLLYKEEKEYALSYLTEENMRKCSQILNDAYDAINCDMELTPVDGALNSSNGNEPILGGIEYEKQLEKCLLYIVKNSGKNNTAHAYDQRTSPYIAAYKLPMEMRGFLCETFSWRLLSAESAPERSMVFGAPHLARLLVKLPEWLNLSPISNEKLEDLLPHLNSFINYLENHKEWFDKENYMSELPRPLQEKN